MSANIWKLDCGAYRLFVIEDGYYWRDPTTYYAAATEHDWRFHPRDDQGRVRLNFGCYVITDGDQTVMIDSGIGDEGAGPPEMIAGMMPTALADLGITPDSVSRVVYTHMHYDHIGGSRRNGRVVLPNARHVFHTREWDHWRSGQSDFGRAAQRIMTPLLEAGLVDFIDQDTEILPGVTALESFGHTPGHLMVTIVSNGTRTYVGGDISNHPFHVEHPDWSLPVDNDHTLAATTRDRVFEEVRRAGSTFVAPHYPMPGVGRIVMDDQTRVYQPGSVPKFE